MKFTTKKYDVAGITTVTFTEEREKPGVNDFCVHATREGIWFSGISQSISNDIELSQLAKQIAEAWKTSKSLRPRLVSAEGTEL